MYTDTQFAAVIERIRLAYIKEEKLTDMDIRFLVSVATSHPVGQLVRFHQKYNHTINELPARMSQTTDDLKLRYELLEEEWHEYSVAHETFIINYNENSFIDMYDALLDIIYVAYGTLLTYGLPAYEGQNEVHFSNMSKAEEKDTYGKTIKGDKYFKPRLKGVLNAIDYTNKHSINNRD